MGDEDLARTIIEGFLEDHSSPDRNVGRVAGAGRRSECPSVKHTRSKELRLAWEARRLCEVALEMEEAARAKDLDAAKASTQELGVRFSRLKQEMEAYLHGEM